MNFILYKARGTLEVESCRVKGMWKIMANSRFEQVKIVVIRKATSVLQGICSSEEATSVELTSHQGNTKSYPWRLGLVELRSIVHLKILHINSNRAARCLRHLVSQKVVVWWKITRHLQRYRDDFGFYWTWKVKTGQLLSIYDSSTPFLTWLGSCKGSG